MALCGHRLGLSNRGVIVASSRCSIAPINALRQPAGSMQCRPLAAMGLRASAMRLGLLRHSTITGAVDTSMEAKPLAGTAAEGDQKPSTAYPFRDIEEKWQRFWEENQTFRTPDDVDTSKPKYYVLDMFPYPRWGPHWHGGRGGRIAW